jgi:hypothetical protein
MQTVVTRGFLVISRMRRECVVTERSGQVTGQIWSGRLARGWRTGCQTLCHPRQLQAQDQSTPKTKEACQGRPKIESFLTENMPLKTETDQGLYSAALRQRHSRLMALRGCERESGTVCPMYSVGYSIRGQRYCISSKLGG